MTEPEEHPFQACIPPNAKKLIIGSIPPQRFCIQKQEPNSLYPNDVNFYYGSRDNSFWDLVGEVFNISFEKENTQSAIDQREKFLRDNSIGITDVVGKCNRLNDSAEDKNLQIIEHKELEQLLKDNPQIDTLIYTSDFIKQQVNVICNTYHSGTDKSKKELTIKIGGQVYDVKILFSPSPNALRNMGKGGKERRRLQYHQFLND